jgi:hypothetical protein
MDSSHIVYGVQRRPRSTYYLYLMAGQCDAIKSTVLWDFKE